MESSGGIYPRSLAGNEPVRNVHSKTRLSVEYASSDLEWSLPAITRLRDCTDILLPIRSQRIHILRSMMSARLEDGSAMRTMTSMNAGIAIRPFCVTSVLRLNVSEAGLNRTSTSTVAKCTLNAGNVLPFPPSPRRPRLPSRGSLVWLGKLMNANDDRWMEPLEVACHLLQSPRAFRAKAPAI